MRKKIYLQCLWILCSGLAFALTSCKKDNKSDITGGSTTSTPTPVKIGLYEADSTIYKLLFISVPKIGNQTVNQFLVFDTGSGGMVIDAHELLPSSMVTDNGITFTGDSTVVNGITILNQTSTIEYGADNATDTKAYGYLAYADVTIGDLTSGNITVKRLPFFLYYKGTDSNGKATSVGDFDVFGVNEEYDVVFPNKAFVTSPFSYYTPATGLTKGFKMAALGTSHFSNNGSFVNNVISLGLTDADLSSNGFTLTSSKFYADEGYIPVSQNTITYNTKSFQGYVLFDTGTEPYSYLLDPTAAKTTTLLSQGSNVSVVGVSNSFNYAYTTSSTENLTYVENPNQSGGTVSILSLEYFLNNEFLIDFSQHRFGVKVN